ncbi:MAG: 3-isopropylmalate dehydrogenase [Candidatus Melainabacteria bacterium]|nr:3-isopropylmalate dehydrogenase [Candidatus Melainabacteria bacterium]
MSASIRPPYHILLLPGDGIGPDVLAQAQALLKVLEARFSVTFTTQTALIGGAAVDVDGVPLPQETLQKALQADAILLGAVGGPQYDALPLAQRPEQGLLQIRKAMGLYANLRPVTAYTSLLHASPLKPERFEGTDLLIVRELTGGLYFGQREQTDTEAYDTMRYSRTEIERVARSAFALAAQRKRRLCSVDKANVLASSRLWRQVVNELANEYPDVAVQHLYVDNAAMQLITNPTQFDVLLTENMFGDILSDEASVLMGSLGMLPSASLGEGKAALYEPAHGSAPDIAGQDKANPIATLLSVAMMMETSFQWPEAAHLIRQAIQVALAEGLRTADIAEPGQPTVGTQAMGARIIQLVGTLPTAVTVSA